MWVLLGVYYLQMLLSCDLCAGPQPRARFLYSMAFYVKEKDMKHVEDARMVIFGGESHDGCFMNDVWEFSLGKGRWEQLSANRPCQKRCKHQSQSNRLETDLDELQGEGGGGGVGKEWGHSGLVGKQQAASALHLAMQQMRQVLRQV